MGAAGTGAAPGGEAGFFGGIFPIILMFAVFYFLLIRPQQKRAKEQKAMRAALKRGDEVVTGGGFFGRIVELTDEYAVLDLGDSKVRVMRDAISPAAILQKKAPSKTAAKKDDPKEAKKADVKKDDKTNVRDDAPKSE